LVKYLEEVQWLIIGSKHPILAYTDHQALVSVIGSDDAHGRICRWQVRLSEFDRDLVHVPGKELAIAVPGDLENLT
jgi:hypothetical protein